VLEASPEGELLAVPEKELLAVPEGEILADGFCVEDFLAAIFDCCARCVYSSRNSDIDRPRDPMD
jgi:hypothetical protein